MNAGHVVRSWPRKWFAQTSNIRIDMYCVVVVVIVLCLCRRGPVTDIICNHTSFKCFCNIFFSISKIIEKD